jgi:hypothetical protein
MTEQRERKAVERSPNFPFIPLESALNRAQRFYEKEKRGSAPFAVAAQHWKYSPASSGALQTAAAMKSYGLMVDEGAGAGRKLRLTELALRILLDTRPDSRERERFKRQAALTPAVAAEIYANSPEGQLPSEATLNHHLVLELGFNQSTPLRAAKIMQQNEEFTKSGAQDLDSMHNESQQHQDILSKAMNRGIGSETPSTGLPMTEQRGPGAKVSSFERTSDGKQEILIQFSVGPTIEAFDFLKDYIDLRIKVLKKAESAAAKEKEKSN